LGPPLLYGGLLDSKWLYALPDVIESLQSNGHCCWIDFYQEVDVVWESDQPRTDREKGKQLRNERLLQRRWFKN